MVLRHAASLAAHRRRVRHAGHADVRVAVDDAALPAVGDGDLARAQGAPTVPEAGAGAILQDLVQVVSC